MLAAPHSILVYVGLDLLGDGLIKLPFARALRSAFPESHITWLAGQGSSVFGGLLAPLVEGLIDELVEDAGVGAAPRQLLGNPLTGTALAGRRFDIVIDTQRRLLTSLILRRVPQGRFISGAGSQHKPASMIGQLLALVERPRRATRCGPPPRFVWATSSTPLRGPCCLRGRAMSAWHRAPAVATSAGPWRTMRSLPGVWPRAAASL